MSENKQVRRDFEHWSRSMDLPLEGGEYGIEPNMMWVYSDFNTDTAYKAYCAAVLSASAGAVPEGYALIPIEPTDAMIHVWLTNDEIHRMRKGNCAAISRVIRLYKKMIDAAINGGKK